MTELSPELEQKAQTLNNKWESGMGEIIANYSTELFRNHDYITEKWGNRVIPMIPGYLEGEYQPWRLTRTPRRQIRGYFTGMSVASHNYALTQDGRVWMSLTPMELDSHIIPLKDAKGEVVIAGLGLGMIVLNMLLKPEVYSITVLEKDQRLIDQWFDMLEGVGRKMASDAFELGRLKIIQCDCKDSSTLPHLGRVDFLYADIWPTLGTEEALSDTRALVRHFNPRACAYWGQELDLIGAMGKNGKKFGETGPDDLLCAMADLDLPFSGRDYAESDLALYLQMTEVAIQNVSNY